METYKYNVTLEQKPIFWLGDRFYKIEKPVDKNVKMVTFYSKCPSCNDTKNILLENINEENSNVDKYYFTQKK